MTLTLPLPDLCNIVVAVRELPGVGQTKDSWGRAEHSRYRALLRKVLRRLFDDIAAENDFDGERRASVGDDTITVDICSFGRRVVVTVTHTSVGGGAPDPELNVCDIHELPNPLAGFRIVRNDRTWRVSQIDGGVIFPRRRNPRRPRQRLVYRIAPPGSYVATSVHERRDACEAAMLVLPANSTASIPNYFSTSFIHYRLQFALFLFSRQCDFKPRIGIAEVVLRASGVDWAGKGSSCSRNPHRDTLLGSSRAAVDRRDGELERRNSSWSTRSLELHTP